MLLAAAALAGPGREVVVSRGQLIEIGGGFRIPEVVGQAGARLVEVGTTNRTRLADYAAALGERTGVILRAHPSNFRTIGFTEEVEIEALCGLGVPVVDDVGSGVLADDLELLAEEPSVRRSVRAGAAVVCFSADKLLGGPQGGLLVGTQRGDRGVPAPPARPRRAHRQALARRAGGDARASTATPSSPAPSCRCWPCSTPSADALDARARRLADGCGGEVVASTAKVGGGALPLLELPGPAVAIDGRRWPSRCARATRRWSAASPTAGCCSTSARSPTRRPTRRRPPSAPRGDDERAAAHARHGRPHRPRQDGAGRRADRQ